MKKELLEKLKNYSKTAAAMAVVGGTANAQIIYTDVHPDTTLNTFPSNYEIDFDGDGNIELNIKMQSSGTTTNYTYFHIDVEVGTGQTSIAAASNGYIAKLSSNFDIGGNTSSQFMQNSGSDMPMIRYIKYLGNTYGNWQETDNMNKFLGVKFKISGSTHYGWIRLSTHYVDKSDIYVTIKDFAYQSIPDSSIYTGAFDSLQIDLGNDTIVCYGDSIQLTAPSGYFGYEWSTLQTDTNSIYVNTTGNYSVTVQDGPEGPVGIDTIYIEINNEITANISDFAEPKCYGSNTGFLDINTLGGAAPYSYNWVAHTDTNLIENLSAGDYAVTITDINNCSIETSFNLAEPAEIAVNFVSDPFCVSCTGEIEATANGGYPPYQYLWNSGSGQTSTDLCEGTYTVTIIDDSLCIKAFDYQIFKSELANISGYLSYSGGNINAGEAIVELYKDTVAGASQLELALTTTIESGGYFELTDIEPEAFYLRGVIASTNTDYENIYTSYYSDVDTTTNWTDATLITLTCEDTIQNIDFKMYEVAAATAGPGIFSGGMTYANGNAKLAGEPVPGAEVFVEQEPNDEPMANTETDTLGNWSIPDIPIGTNYRLTVDIPGLPLISTYHGLEVTGTKSVINDLNFFVDTLSATGGIYTDTTTSIINVNSENIEIKTYPNPVNDYFTIETDIKNSELVSYSLIDINGKEIIVTEEKYYQGKYIEQINMKNLDEGVFFLKIKIGNAIYIRKIIKK